MPSPLDFLRRVWNPVKITIRDFFRGISPRARGWQGESMVPLDAIGVESACQTAVEPREGEAFDMDDEPAEPAEHVQANTPTEFTFVTAESNDVPTNHDHGATTEPIISPTNLDTDATCYAASATPNEPATPTVPVPTTTIAPPTSATPVPFTSTEPNEPPLPTVSPNAPATATPVPSDIRRRIAIAQYMISLRLHYAAIAIHHAQTLARGPAAHNNNASLSDLAAEQMELAAHHFCFALLATQQLMDLQRAFVIPDLQTEELTAGDYGGGDAAVEAALQQIEDACVADTLRMQSGLPIPREGQVEHDNLGSSSHHTPRSPPFTRMAHSNQTQTIQTAPVLDEGGRTNNPDNVQTPILEDTIHTPSRPPTRTQKRKAARKAAKSAKAAGSSTVTKSTTSTAASSSTAPTSSTPNKHVTHDPQV